MQHAIERVGRPGGSHEGVGRKKKTSSCSIALKIQLDEPSARGTQESP